MKDDQLLEKIAAQDVTALNRLHARYSNKIFRQACRLLENAYSSEDSVQEILLQVLYRATTFTPGQSTLINWLDNVLRNRALVIFRQRSVQREENWTDLEVVWKISLTMG